SCCVAATGGKALPACPTQLSLRAVPFHPGELRHCSQTSLHTGCLASTLLEVWPLSFFWFNEAASGSLALRLTGSLHGAAAQQVPRFARSPARRAKLTAFASFYLVPRDSVEAAGDWSGHG